MSKNIARQDDENIIQRKSAIILDITLKFIIMYLGIMVSVLSLVESFDIKCNKGLIWLFTFAVLFMFLLVLKSKRRNLLLGILIITVLIGAILLRGYLKVGILSLANVILYRYQEYFDNAHSYSFDISTKGLKWSSLYWYNTIIICTVIIEYAYIIMTATLHKIYAAVHFILLAIFIALPMVLGLFPPIYVVVMLMIYCILCLAFQHDRRMELKRALYLITATLISAGIIFVCVNPKTYEKKSRFDQVKTVMDNFFEELNFNKIIVEDIFKIKSDKKTYSGGLSKGTLGEADTLEFRNIDVLGVSLPYQEEKVYLKGYAADYYAGNKWINQKYDLMYNKMLKEFCFIENINDTSDQTSLEIGNEIIMSQNYNYFKKIITQINGIPPLPNSISIINIAQDNNYYIPYNSLITDRITTQDYMVAGHNYDSVSSLDYEFINISLNTYSNMLNDKKDNEDLFSNMDYEEGYQLYREYVYKTNLLIPVSVEIIFDELFPDAPKYDGENLSSIIECINYTKEYLHKNTTYTLSPGRLKGDDFVLEFLLHKKKGYCTSYASATVLMLRYMGIPARYAEGYVITPKETMGKSFSSTDSGMIFVKDSSAHAWAEVFIDNVGFMTVDTTPEYDDSEGNLVEPESTNESTETTTKPEESSTQNLETSSNTESSIETKSQTTDETENTTQDSISKSNTVLIIIASVASLILLSVVIFLYWNKKKANIPIIYKSIKELSYERQIIIIKSEELFELLRKQGIFYGLEKYTEEYAAEIEEKLKEAEEGNKEIKEDFKLSALEFLEIYQYAKYSDINSEISKQNYKKAVNYVDKCKNSLQYLKK